MMSFTKCCCILLAIVSAKRAVSAELTREQVARVSAAGLSVYVPVKREFIESHLILHNVQGPELYLPEGPIFDNQPEGTHPILIDIGHIFFKDFYESESANPDDVPVSTEGAEITITIPFLSESHEGPYSFGLGLMILYDRQRGEIPESDFIYPYIGVDEVVLGNSGLVVRLGEGAIRIDFDFLDECDDEEWTAGSSSEGSEEDGLLFSILQPLGADRHFCSNYPYENQFCTRLGDIEEGLQANAPNICVAWNSGNEQSCETSAEIIEISGIFKYILGYEEGAEPVHVEQYEGAYDIGAKFPCV